MIRQAIPSDAPSVIPLMLEAIGSIAFILTGVTEEEGAARILGHFFRQEGNRSVTRTPSFSKMPDKSSDWS